MRIDLTRAYIYKQKKKKEKIKSDDIYKRKETAAIKF